MLGARRLAVCREQYRKGRLYSSLILDLKTASEHRKGSSVQEGSSKSGRLGTEDEERQRYIEDRQDYLDLRHATAMTWPAAYRRRRECAQRRAGGASRAPGRSDNLLKRAQA